MRNIIECKICGKEFKCISAHIRTHNISIKEYKQKFPNSKLVNASWTKQIKLKLKNRKFTEEWKAKISKAKLGKSLSEKHRESIRKTLTGRKHTEKAKENMRKSHIGRIVSKQTGIKISNKLKGHKISEETKQKIRITNTGKKHTKETKLKMRLSAIKHIEKYRGKMKCNIGKNEKEILDAIEAENNISITRQYFCKGYFLDGYDEENNIAYEIDEPTHNKERDIVRQIDIEEELDCNFIRVLDK